MILAVGFIDGGTTLGEAAADGFSFRMVGLGIGVVDLDLDLDLVLALAFWLFWLFWLL